MKKEYFVKIVSLFFVEFEDILKECGISFCVIDDVKEKIVEIGYYFVFGVCLFRRMI